MIQSLPEPALAPPQADDVPMTCPTCKQHRSRLSFEFLPFDGRCKLCIDPDEIADLREQAKLQAAREFAQVLDLTGAPPPSAPNINDLVAHIFEEWGGYRLFAHDYVMQMKAAIRNRPGSDGVVKMMQKLMDTTTKGNSLQQQEDLARMSDEQIRDRNKIAALAVMAEIVQDDAKGKLLADLLRANGLLPNPALIAEVQRG